ncbi:MAG TPA: Uma2 family endonuclease [Gammaproteobacteria bacterium]|nr:Uma2 family endonuclease [Gammaproteobacteria bacterium]
MTALAYKSVSDNYISVKEYLEGEKISHIKHEYINGQVVAMAGASLKHNIISANIFALLWNHLKDKSCFPLSSDMLLETSSTQYRYPDVMVVCDNDSSEDDYIRKNPLIIIEVLSKTTRKKDKVEKRKEYLALSSLQEYILIEQDFAEIDVQQRSENWRSSYYYLGDQITLKSVDITLSVEDIYQRIDNNDIQDFLRQKKEQKQQEE